MNRESVALDPIATAPDEQMRHLVDDLVAAQRSPPTAVATAFVHNID
jgi:hypothetical protein